MGDMKRLLVISLVAVVLVSPVSALSEEQTSEISQSCSTIKQHLKNLQLADSRTRSSLGTAYQDFLVSYITPLNVNLVKNNRPSTTISGIYSDILDTRAKFNSRFTTYSQIFEQLLAMDCQKEPENFYAKIEEAREARGKLESSAKKMRSLLGNHYTAVQKLEESL